MKQLWTVPVVGALALALLMSPEFARPGRRELFVRVSFLVLVAASLAAVIAFWVLTIAELLRRGPGAQREWWFAALVVVVLLGPLGAVAYRIAQPNFDATKDQTRHL